LLIFYSKYLVLSIKIWVSRSKYQDPS